MSERPDLPLLLLGLARDDEFAARSLLPVAGVADAILGFHNQREHADPAPSGQVVGAGPPKALVQGRGIRTGPPRLHPQHDRQESRTTW